MFYDVVAFCVKGSVGIWAGHKHAVPGCLYQLPLSLGSPVQVLKRLAASADVFLEPFRPGAGASGYDEALDFWIVIKHFSIPGKYELTC